ncbi:hypothetical protein WA158_007929 [Blastocystis sp. Blastoise]
MQAQSPKAKSHKWELIAILLVVLLDFVGYSIVIAMLPYFAEDIGGNASQVGYLFSGYSATQIIGTLLMGYLSDLFGRKPFLIMCLTGSFIFICLQAFSTNIWMLIVSRCLIGLFSNSRCVAQAFIADLTEGKERANYIAKIEGYVSVGYVIGPAIGGFLGEIDHRTPFYVACVSSFLTLMVGLFGIHESNSKINVMNDLKQKKKNATSEEDKNAIENSIEEEKKKHKLSKDMKLPPFSWTIVICFMSEFLCRWLSCSFDCVYGVYGIAKFNMTSLEYSLITSMAALMLAIFDIFCYNPILKHTSISIPLLTALGTIAIFIGNGLIMVPYYWVSIFGVAILWFSLGCVAPYSPTILSCITNKYTQGTVLSFGTIIGQLSYVISPLVLTPLVDIQNDLPYLVDIPICIFYFILIMISYCMPGGKQLGRQSEEVETESVENTETKKETISEEEVSKIESTTVAVPCAIEENKQDISTVAEPNTPINSASIV